MKFFKWKMPDLPTMFLIICGLCIGYLVSPTPVHAQSSVEVSNRIATALESIAETLKKIERKKID